MRDWRFLPSLVLVFVPALAAAQEGPAIPEELEQTFGAFAAAMLEGNAQAALEYYADDAVVLVDHEHVYRGRSAIRSGFLAEDLDEATRAVEDGSRTEIGVDGSWKLAASVMTFESSAGAPSQSAAGFSCTQVLGFSQSMEWYAGLSVADYLDRNTRPDLSALGPGAFLPTWEGRFFMGAVVERWMDPDFQGWTGTHRMAYETPAHCGRDEVDRVVFNVSGEARTPDAWAAAVDSVAGVIRSKFPAVRTIVMQPVVGAPDGQCTDVRAARNHPVIAEGIRRAADRGGITAGPSPKVAGCDQFTDTLGHLTVEGAEHVRQALREHYRP